MHTYPLPESARDSLKQPFGVLIPDSQVTRDAVMSKLVGRNKIIVCVGDRTTERVREMRIFANLEIIDKLEKRKSRDTEPGIFGSNERMLNADNPAGSLTDQSLDSLRKSLELIRAEPKKSVRIEVNGEEDLLALPVLAFFPENTIVLYGQPNEGLVIVGAMGDARDLARKVLATMGVRTPKI